MSMGIEESGAGTIHKFIERVGVAKVVYLAIGSVDVTRRVIYCSVQVRG